MNNYSLFKTQLDNLLESKYCRNGCYLKFIYNGYKNKQINVLESEFSRLLFINTKSQKITVHENTTNELIKEFLSLSNEELKCLQDDITELIEMSKKWNNNNHDNTSAERMLYVFLSMI